MPFGVSKSSHFFGKVFALGGSVTFNGPGTFTPPAGVQIVNATVRGGTGNPGTAGNGGTGNSVTYQSPNQGTQPLPFNSNVNTFCGPYVTQHNVSIQNIYTTNFSSGIGAVANLPGGGGGAGRAGVPFILDNNTPFSISSASFSDGAGQVYPNATGSYAMTNPCSGCAAGQIVNLAPGGNIGQPAQNINYSSAFPIFNGNSNPGNAGSAGNTGNNSSFINITVTGGVGGTGNPGNSGIGGTFVGKSPTLGGVAGVPGMPATSNGPGAPASIDTNLYNPVGTSNPSVYGTSGCPYYGSLNYGYTSGFSRSGTIKNTPTNSFLGVGYAGGTFRYPTYTNNIYRQYVGVGQTGEGSQVSSVSNPSPNRPLGQIGAYIGGAGSPGSFGQSGDTNSASMNSASSGAPGSANPGSPGSTVNSQMAIDCLSAYPVTVAPGGVVTITWNDQ